MRLIKPDFTNNIVNLSATLAEYLGCPNDKPTLPMLADELKKGYKNVVFVILDGLGMHPMQTNLDEGSFLRSNLRRVLTSVFPSTTTNATATLLSNLYPMEHGRFGWSLYFEELRRVVELFPETDFFTGEPVGAGFLTQNLPLVPFYKRATARIQTSVVVPEYWHEDNENRYTFRTFAEMYAHILALCKRAGRQFVYVYCGEPDAAMHRHGVTSDEAKRTTHVLDEGLKMMFSALSDTLLVVTADHGQIDMGGEIALYRDEELLSMLEWPQYLEPRATAFKIKRGQHAAFSKMFTEKYGADFLLRRTEDLVRENYFGGNFSGEHARLLGDFIAIGTTDKLFRMSARSHSYRGHHTSLTAEMEVPLIFIGDK